MKVGPVREAHRIDEEALLGWLRGRVEGDDEALIIEQFDAGQSNPTYRLSLGPHRYVLRKKPPGKLLPKAHAVEREARVMAALASTEVPVPRILGLCEDPDLIGTPFFVMEMLEGRILWDARLPDQPEETRADMWAEMARVLAALHTVDLEEVGLVQLSNGAKIIFPPGSAHEQPLIVVKSDGSPTESQTPDLTTPV